MRLLQRNIDYPGRALRAGGGLLFALLAAAAWPHSRVATAFLSVAAAFLFFEAAGGWCAARACGIKTPL